MGGKPWSDDHYKDRLIARDAIAKDRGVSAVDVAFAYDSDVKAGRASGVHKSLDPRGVVFRESRDSEAHPEALPLSALLDVTGSMSSVPKKVQAHLGKLMQLLIRKGYAEHPALLVGAIGDATVDRVPLQVGQFESSLEIEENLTNLYLEGGGGGHITESYELALYFMARHTVHDHMEKRGRKGYLFLIGDEIPYPMVNRSQVKAVFGDTLDQDIPVESIIEEVKEKYEVFYILPKMTSNYNNKTVFETWTRLLGQNVIRLDDADSICELIASQVALFEGAIDGPDEAEKDLVDVGTDKAAARSVGRALVPAGDGKGRKGKGIAQKLPDSGAASGVVKF